MGRRHMRVVRDIGLVLAGICDQSTPAMAEAAKEFGIASDLQFTDAVALLKKARPECVVVATTAPSHCEYTCLAAENGAQYILCEKPMAVSLAECERMIETCGRYRVKLAINHQMRFMQQYVVPKRIIQSESFGGLSSITVIAGNIGIAMNGTHYFEMFRFMTDEYPKEVVAWLVEQAGPNPRGPQYHDKAGSVRITTARGRRLYMEMGPDQGHGLHIAFSGRQGLLVGNQLTGRMNLSVREDKYREMPTTRYDLPCVERDFNIEPADSLAPTKAVLASLLEGGNPPSGEDGRMALATLVAAHVSSERGHVPIAVDGDLPLDRTFHWP